jgi:hypothetical protein
MVRSSLMTPSARRSGRSASRAPQSRFAPRAPRRAGARTTLRVPDDLAESVARYAEQHRTSTNDALVRLAYDGAERYEQEREIEQLARVRREAIMRLSEVPSDIRVPTSAETTAAILAWRRGEIE